MRINTNLTAMNTYTQYTKNQSKISSAVAKLSSGYAINSAADNAAGLAISEKMRAQIRGLDKASSNAQDAISLVQSAEGALDSSTEILQRMRELAVQSSSDTNNDSIDRTALQDEFKQLQSELNNISSNTTFNKKNLLDGSLASTTTSVKVGTLANSGMAISTGSVQAGSYTFNIGIRQETAAIAAKTGTTTASLGSTAAATFSSASGVNPSKTGALYNGNYKLSTTVNNDGSLTVTANGDNNQSFKATLSATTLASASAGSTLSLNFESSTGAGDGFGAGLKLTAAVSTTTNGLNALASAINDTTVSVDGGIDAAAATFGVYANMTGGNSVKLQASDTGVTFDNGVTVGFDKLAATDATVSLTSAATTTAGVVAGTSSIAAGVTTAVAGTDGPPATAATQSIVLTGIAGDYTLGDVKTYNLQIGGNNYSYTTTGQEADSNAVADAIGNAIVGSTMSLTTTNGAKTDTFTAGYTAGTDTVLFTSATTGAAIYSALNVSGSVTTAGLSTGLANKTGTAANQATAAAGHLSATGNTTFSVSKEANAGLTFQVGANEGDEMTINIEKMDSETLGVNSAKVDTQQAAKAAIASVDAAINAVSAQRATLGAVQNRLEYKIDNLNTSSTNLTSAESQIRDVDMAKEMTDFTNANILSQAATAMLAQANSLPQSVLSLIKG